MTQLSKTGTGPGLMKIDHALDLLADFCQPVTPIEKIPLSEGLGRILGRDIIADRDVPPTPNSAVDGYAVRFSDLSSETETILPVSGRAAAGHPLNRPSDVGQAVRIFTGAVMPVGCDTVVMQEDCRLISNPSANSPDKISVPPGLRQGNNAREKGEDIRLGTTLLTAGHRMRPQDLGLIASIGHDRLDVFSPLKVAVFSTGDEVHDPGSQLPAGAIYDANRTCLLALLRGLNCRVSDLGILPDDGEIIAQKLGQAAQSHDLIITSGGVSVGDEDHVRNAVEAVGGLNFWRLAIKPGRPVAMGEIGTAAFIGLPGNPAAMMVTFLRVARPAILALGGGQSITPPLFPVTSDFNHAKKPGRREFIRARLSQNDAGQLVAQKFPRAGAGILSSFVGASGLVELPEDMTQLNIGETVAFLPFSEVM